MPILAKRHSEQFAVLVALGDPRKLMNPAPVGDPPEVVVLDDARAAKTELPRVAAARCHCLGAGLQAVPGLSAGLNETIEGH